MYNVGDKVIYGETGVCQITEITEKDITGAPALYYVLEPCYQGYTIFAPVENCRVFMRPIITKDEAISLIDEIPHIDAEIFHGSTLREQIEHYEAMVKSHDCKDLVELTMSIQAKKRAAIEAKRKVGAVDEKFMKRAEELLFGELAMALEIPKSDVPGFIKTRLAAN